VRLLSGAQRGTGAEGVEGRAAVAQRSTRRPSRHLSGHAHDDMRAAPWFISAWLRPAHRTIADPCTGWAAQHGGGWAGGTRPRRGCRCGGRSLRPSWRPFSTEIDLCDACSCQEILRCNGRGQAAERGRCGRARAKAERARQDPTWAELLAEEVILSSFFLCACSAWCTRRPVPHSSAPSRRRSATASTRRHGRQPLTGAAAWPRPLRLKISGQEQEFHR
jgi:hypothetical protein